MAGNRQAELIDRDDAPRVRLLADAGIHCFEIDVHPDADLDGTFSCICVDTGERLKLNGWLWSFEPVEG